MSPRGGNGRHAIRSWNQNKKNSRKKELQSRWTVIKSFMCPEGNGPKAGKEIQKKRGYIHYEGNERGEPLGRTLHNEGKMVRDAWEDSPQLAWEGEKRKNQKKLPRHGGYQKRHKRKKEKLN